MLMSFSLLEGPCNFCVSGPSIELFFPQPHVSAPKTAIDMVKTPRIALDENFYRDISYPYPRFPSLGKDCLPLKCATASIHHSLSRIHD